MDSGRCRSANYGIVRRCPRLRAKLEELRYLNYEREPRLPHRAIGLGDLGVPQHKQEHKCKGIFCLPRSCADPQIVRAKVAGTIGSTWSAVSPRSSLL